MPKYNDCLVMKAFFNRYKYELLLLALLQHLFVGVILDDFDLYQKVIWPINMIILGIASVGVFLEKGRWKNIVRNILFVLVVLFPIYLPIFGHSQDYFLTLNVIYVFFFSFILWEVMKFLIRPSYINTDIIIASACGYLLLLEILVFIMQFLYYSNTDAIKGIDSTNHSVTFIDLVYFGAITITSIGFGDITPNNHYTKLITAFFGIIGQFYSVVLIGILISKFTSNQKD